MKKLRRLICKKFGHNYIYHLSESSGKIVDFRHCKCCHVMEEYRDMPILGKGWYILVSRTKFGANERLKELTN